MNKTISITEKSHELLKALTEKSKRSLIMELEVVLEEYVEMKNKPDPQPQALVCQPQPQLQSEPQFYMGMPRDPDMRPQWQLDEIDRLKSEKLVRTNELSKVCDDELGEYMEQKGWNQEGAEAIVERYKKQIEAVEKEIDGKLDAIYNN